jgi:predicted AAA+ superfamily ATPase
MPLVIDEAKKVPEIFDAVKLRVDQDSQPGQYLLLGSTEFSHLFKIRESLTGRLSRLRLHPLCAAEAHQLKQTKGDLGGGFFYSHPRLSLGDVLSSMEREGGCLEFLL